MSPPMPPEHALIAAPDGRWEVRSAVPGADLAGLVLGYQGYVEHGGPVLCQREVATTQIPVIVNFGPAFRIASSGGAPESRGCFVAGLDSGYATVASTGPSHCMQVDFTPPGALRFFGGAMGELAGFVVMLDDVLGPELARLTERLYEADWPGRFAILDAFVRARLARMPAPSAEVDWAWRRLRASHGRVRIARLAERLGWSRKHLADRFSRELGRPPKTVARLLRFEHLHAAIDPAAPLDWSDLAYQHGYADQAHLIREFRHFAGITPTRFLSERRLLG